MGSRKCPEFDGLLKKKIQTNPTKSITHYFEQSYRFSFINIMNIYDQTTYQQFSLSIEKEKIFLELFRDNIVLKITETMFIQKISISSKFSQ